jgi:glycine dehydrogenase
MVFQKNQLVQLAQQIIVVPHYYQYHIYISSMGENLTESTKIAILNANYIKDRLKPFYKIFKENKNNRVAHEFIIDLYEFKNLGISDNDISKRLMDYNFHAPTVSWPVDNSLMIEPTESEDYDEIERFINAMIKIKEEINEIENGLYSKESNVFKNSPHTEMDLLNWNYDYSIEKGCFPDSTLLKHKKWPNRNRIDNVYGDKLLIKENS